MKHLRRCRPWPTRYSCAWALLPSSWWGGSPTFPTHVHRAGVECSPGTFVFWDRSYVLQMPELPFEYAALVITRVISIIDHQTICTDTGP